MSEGGGKRDSETLDRAPDESATSRPRASGPPGSDLVGRALLHFRVVERLGEGGMGVVYRAVDEKLRRSVALKVLSARYLADDRNTEILFREARAAASVAHANIGAIHELHDTADPPFIVMELAIGETLRARMERAPLRVDETLAIARSIGSALACAHESGLVHRDLKPENVMVSAAGGVKVLDFGLAKASHESELPVFGREAGGVHALALTLPASHHSTRRGRVMGTLAYMSPEQSRGDVVDARTDVFAFGVVLYEMLARVLPFARAAAEPWHWGDASSDDWRVGAPLRRANPRPPRALAKIVERCLAYDAAERFANGAEIVRALDGVRARERGRLAPFAFAFAGVAGVAGLALFASVRARSKADGSSSSAPVVAAARECAKNTDCVKKNGGKPFVCTARGACAPIASEACEARFEPGDLERDDTIWIGAMFPTSGEAASYGVLESNAVELGRRDFAEARRHLAPRAGEPAQRPLAVVACDDAAGDPERQARHLVSDVGVPAVIGFRTSVETLDLATSILAPSDVMTVVSVSVSARLDGIPSVAGQPRMVWRTTYDAASTAVPIAALVALREGQLHLAPSEPMRVALVRPKNRNVESFADELMASLRFNGKSALENDARYREFALDDVGEHQNDEPTARAIASFAPHVIVAIAEGDFLERVEQAWPASAPRPFYLTNGPVGADLLPFLAKRADRRQRFFGLTTVSSTAPNARFVVHYNETFAPPVTRTFAPNGSYDALYLVAYAAYAAPAATGPDLARSVERLVRGSTHVDVGPSGILAAFAAVRRGDAIDLDGALGKLDFDLETGEAPVDFAVVCADVDASGRVVGSVESGLVFDAEQRTMTGNARCP